MKTYSLFFTLLALFALGCSKSEEPTDEGGKLKHKGKAAYTLLLKRNGRLIGTLLHADNNKISTVDYADIGFETTDTPLLLFEEDRILTMYHKTSDCTGNITVHDFKTGTFKRREIFTDLDACQLTAKAIVKAGSTVYLAYESGASDKTVASFVRAIDISGSESSFKDVALAFRPQGLAFANNRLFVLGLDDAITGKHKLTVFDEKTTTSPYTQNLGFDALGIFKDFDGDIIIGYEDHHTTFDSASLDYDFTNYPSGAFPNFTGSEFRYFDSSGRMYYAMLAGTHSSYERIPAVYDFEMNSTVLYAYENFLTEAERDFKFEIENTTVVRYDEANNLLLVGYKKSGGDDRGGILRINPVPNPAFAGNLDLDGIPYAIYVD
ncbi:MAG TPA: hypothetical protein VFM69_06535 [Pricia sp.]|nr:hypothetical protein [Pricia sp.]